MANNDGRIEGFFLSFSPAESKKLDADMTRLGYSFDCKGVKAFLLDCSRNRKKAPGNIDRLIAELEEKVRSNPEAALAAVNNIAGSAIDIFDGILNAIKKPR